MIITRLCQTVLLLFVAGKKSDFADQKAPPFVLVEKKNGSVLGSNGFMNKGLSSKIIQQHLRETTHLSETALNCLRRALLV